MKKIISFTALTVLANCGGSTLPPVEVTSPGKPLYGGYYKTQFPNPDGTFDEPIAANRKEAAVSIDGNGYGLLMGDDAEGNTVAFYGILPTTDVGVEVPISAPEASYEGEYHFIIEGKPVQTGPMDFKVFFQEQVLFGLHLDPDVPPGQPDEIVQIRGEIEGSKISGGFALHYIEDSFVWDKPHVYETTNGVVSGVIGDKGLVGVFASDNVPLPDGEFIHPDHYVIGGFYGVRTE